MSSRMFVGAGGAPGFEAVHATGRDEATAVACSLPARLNGRAPGEVDRHRGASASVLLLLALLSLAFVALMMAPGAANAATASPSYAVGDTFGRATYGDSFGTAGNIAVGQSTGNIFIAEHNRSTVSVFPPGANDANPLTDADFNAIPIFPLAVAVDPTDDSIYTDDYFYNASAIGKAISDQAPTPTYTLDSTFAPPPGLIVTPGALAVDPTSRDLLVADLANNRVYRLDGTTGADLLLSFDGADTSGGAFQSVGALAVGPTGKVYVVDANSRVETFDANGATQGALALPAGAQPSGLAVNPTTGEVVVMISLDGETYLQGFTAAGTETFRVNTTSAAPFPGFGLAWDGGTDRIYASLGDGTAVTFNPAQQPGVDPPVVTSTGRDTAHVEATIDTGGQLSSARIEYCRAALPCDSYIASDPSDPQNPWERGPLHSGLSGASPETIDDDLPLTSNVSYKLRTYAANDDIANTSATTTFVTPLLPPVVVTREAGSISTAEAVFSGTINAVGDQTTYHFEYGTDTAYGSRVPVASEAVAGNSHVARTVTQDVSGLLPGTTYHYRLVARNSAGETSGADQSFTTAGPQDAAPARAYEQVTPADKQGAQVNSDFHVQSAADGSAIAVSTASTAPGGATAHIRQNYMSRRGSSDWLNWSQIDAPQDVASLLLESTTLAISEDFDHALVASNRVLAPGAIAGGGNLFVQNLRTGEYTFVGGAPGKLAFAGMAGGQTSETVFVAGAPDFSWIVFTSPSAVLLPGVPGLQSRAVYRWDRTGGLALASVMDDGTAPSASTQAMQVAAVHHTVSADGKVVYFGLDSGAVYRREDGHTTLVSHSDGTTAIPTNIALPAFLDGVSKDGRYAFFHTAFGLPLTSDPIVSGGGALYRYDSQTDQIQFVVSVSNTGQNAIISDDGGTIYVDRNQSADPVLRGPTVMWRNGVLRTIDPDGMDAPTVSPSGQYLSWVRRSDHSARLYDAVADQTVCVSCPLDGSPGGAVRTRTDARSIGNQTPRVVNDDGTTFFDSPARLVKADHNGKRDVYMYYKGRLSLISPGDADFDARFVDASADGRDVFFQTDQGLVGRDVDGNTDVYDARVGGGFSAQWPAQPPARCVRTECAEAGSGPVMSMPAPTTNVQPETPKRTNQPKVRLTLGTVRFGSKSVRIAFQASGKGRVIVSGTRVTTTIRNVSKAGAYTVTVPLSKKARALLRTHKKFKVSLKVSLYGGWGSASAKYSRTLGK
jgi:sugar lactone lactonase YvrE